MRCKDRKTEVAVSMTGFIKCGTDVRFIYRIDQEQAVETPWRSHPSCYLALAPTHTKLRHNLGECLEEPLGPPGRWISAGWWCPPQAPRKPTHPARDPGPISVPGSSLYGLVVPDVSGD